MIIHIIDIKDPRVVAYSGLTEAQLRNRLHPNQGLFIAESPKVISVALDAGYRPLSILTEERHITGDAREIISRAGDQVPVYTGTRQLLAQLTGYTLTRGVLCAMRRPQPPSLAQVLHEARRIVSQFFRKNKNARKRNVYRHLWRSWWDSNPRIPVGINAFRVRPVMTTSIQLRA